MEAGAAPGVGTQFPAVVPVPRPAHGLRLSQDLPPCPAEDTKSGQAAVVLLCLCSSPRGKSLPHRFGAKLGAVLAPHSPGEVSGVSLRLWAPPRETKSCPVSSPSLLSSLQALHVHLDLPGPENKHPHQQRGLAQTQEILQLLSRVWDVLTPPTSPREETPSSSSSSPLQQPPFSFPPCRCFRELPKGAAAAKPLIPVLVRG